MRIERYFNYSYVGAPWKVDYGVPCGNGGFSLRNKNDMLKVVSVLKHTDQFDRFNEDMWYSIGCVLLKLNIAPKEEASFFSSETIFNKDSCGVHKPHFPETDLMEYLDSIVW